MTPIDWSAVAAGFGGRFAQDDDHRTHGFAPAVAAELVRAGIIYQAAGRWRIANANRTIVDDGRRGDLAICDFCSERPIAFDAIVADYVQPGQPGFGSRGNWAACAACGHLIAQTNRAGLLERVRQHRSVAGGTDWSRDPRFLEAMRRLLDGFWTHYRGELTPIDPGRDPEPQP